MFNFKHFKILIPILLTILILPISVFGMVNGTIKGKVIDKQTGEALPGANIIIKGTTMGAASGPDGSYTIANVPPGTYTLVATFIGYDVAEQQVNVVADEVANVNFGMRIDVYKAEEIVVTGIASKTSRAVAEVSVSRVAASELTNVNTYQGTDQLINGKIAGVRVKRSSGNAGAGFRFTVRSGGGLNGDEQPIIYVDGVRIDNSEFKGNYVGGQGISLLADLNPEEIENIEVLKGPAGAASYGTSGANGVILITTKRGKLTPGAVRGVDLQYKVVTGWNTQAEDYSTKDFVSANDANAIFHTGHIIQNTISAAGGSNLLRYFASFDSRIEDSITHNNSMNRKTIRANFDVVPNDKLTFRINTNYTYNTLRRPENDNNIIGFLGNTLLFPTSYLFSDSTAIEGVVDKNVSNRFIGSLQAEWSPFKGFTGRFSVGIDEHDLRQDQTFPVNLDYGVSQLDQGDRAIWIRRSRQFTYTIDGNYNFSPFTDLKINAVLGAQLFDRRLEQVITEKFGFLTELISNIGAGQQLQSLDETFSHRREAGIFGEVNFSLREQYFFTFKLRRDYASVIGKNAPSIFYPGASFALRLDKYNFLPSQLNLFKFRVAYGETGILPALLDGIPLLYTAEPGGPGVGGVIGQIGNDKIKPERVKEFEIGFDAEIFNNYAIEFTHYRQKAKDSIIGRRLPPSTGKTASPVPFNIGESKGWGFELLFQGTPIRSRKFSLDFTLINSWQDNEVQDLGGAQPIFDGFDVNVIKEGLPKHEFFVIPVLGAEFDPQTGEYLGPKLGEDRVAMGNPVPTYNGSFTLNIRFLKNFNLYILTDWATGHKIFNLTNQFAYRFGNNPRFNELATMLGLAGKGVARFSQPVEGVEQLTPGTPEYQKAAEEFAKLDWRYDANFIEDADFFKLREISISYSFKDLLPKLFGANRAIRDLVITFSANNVFTAKKYSGAEVELDWNGSRSLSRGQDFLTLQNPRVYNLQFRFSL